MNIAEGEEWEPLAGIGANARPGGRGGDRAIADPARQARRAISAASPSPRFPRRPATSNRPRPRSAASCSTSAAPAATLPTASSPPRPTSPSRPTSAPGSTSAACSSAREMRDVFAAEKIASAQKWSATSKGQHIELGIAENNLFLMLAALGPRRRPVRRAAVPDRNALRSVHRPRPRCAQLRLLPGRALPARRDPQRDHLGPRRRRPPVDQPAADRAGPARPAPLRTRLRRRARGDDGRSVPPDRRARRRIDLPPPLDPLDPPGRARRRRLEGRRA